MKTLRWFLWAIRVVFPLSDEKFKAWLKDCPNDVLASSGQYAAPAPESVRPGEDPFSRKVEDGTQRTLTAEQWRSYNHRYAREFVHAQSAATFERCAKCEMAQSFPIHWLADKLAAHGRRGGLPADFQIPVHEFWRTSSIDACGICGRALDHVNHPTVERTEPEQAAKPDEAKI